MVKSRAVQTQPKPDNLAKPLDANLIPTRTEGPVGRWWVSVLKNRHRWVEWQVYTYKTRATWTKQELQKNPAKSCKNKLDPTRSRLDPAKSSGI